MALDLDLVRRMLAMSTTAGIVIAEDPEPTLGSVLVATADEPDDHAVVPVARDMIAAMDEALTTRVR
jgi:hypothetical protein